MLNIILTEYFCGIDPLGEIFFLQLSIEKRIVAGITKVKNLFQANVEVTITQPFTKAYATDSDLIDYPSKLFLYLLFFIF